jgi:hypothetical protein
VELTLDCCPVSVAAGVAVVIRGSGVGPTVDACAAIAGTAVGFGVAATGACAVVVMRTFFAGAIRGADCEDACAAGVGATTAASTSGNGLALAGEATTGVAPVTLASDAGATTGTLVGVGALCCAGATITGLAICTLLLVAGLGVCTGATAGVCCPKTDKASNMVIARNAVIFFILCFSYSASIFDDCELFVFGANQMIRMAGSLV